jgi:hypothetical protein
MWWSCFGVSSFLSRVVVCSVFRWVLLLLVCHPASFPTATAVFVCPFVAVVFLWILSFWKCFGWCYVAAIMGVIGALMVVVDAVFLGDMEVGLGFEFGSCGGGGAL